MRNYADPTQKEVQREDARNRKREREREAKSTASQVKSATFPPYVRSAQHRTQTEKEEDRHLVSCSGSERCKRTLLLSLSLSLSSFPIQQHGDGGEHIVASDYNTTSHPTGPAHTSAGIRPPSSSLPSRLLAHRHSRGRQQTGDL